MLVKIQKLAWSIILDSHLNAELDNSPNAKLAHCCLTQETRIWRDGRLPKCGLRECARLVKMRVW